jgi:Mrp family chromosome partitioning ATPase
LNGRVSVDEALRTWRDDVPLHVLAGSGTDPDSGAAPLRQADVAELCKQLVRRADVVIFVAPPVLADSDATSVARAVGRAIPVAQARATRLPDFIQSILRLRSLGVTVLGAVLSGERGRRSRPYVPVVSPPARVDGHDVRREYQGRSHTAAWSSGRGTVPRLEREGEPR